MNVNKEFLGNTLKVFSDGYATNQYLKKLAKSIRVDFTCDPLCSVDYQLNEFVTSEGYGDDRSYSDWDTRLHNWEESGAIIIELGDGICIPVFKSILDKVVDNNEFCGTNSNVTTAFYTNLRYKGHKIWPTISSTTNERDGKTKLANIDGNALVDGTINSTPITEKETMTQSIKNTANSVVDVNKEALVLAGKLGTGKAANQLLLSKLASKLPWYAKLFGKKKEIANNPVAKLASANLMKALTQHFAKDNKKMQYIADAMVTEAMVEATVYSQTFEDILASLDEAIDLPSDIKARFSDSE